MGRKFIIELEDEPLRDSDGKDLFRAKGFNSLVFDKNGLDKLKELDKSEIESRENDKMYFYLDDTGIVVGTNYSDNDPTAIRRETLGNMFDTYLDAAEAVHQARVRVRMKKYAYNFKKDGKPTCPLYCIGIDIHGNLSPQIMWSPNWSSYTCAKALANQMMLFTYRNCTSCIANVGTDIMKFYLGLDVDEAKEDAKLFYDKCLKDECTIVKRSR